MNWDIQIFRYINSESANAFLDFLCPILRFPKTWIPLYISMLVLAILKYKSNVWLWVLFCILCITLTDQISSQWLKYLFDRPRPCTVPDITNAILRVNRCPGNASFPSSHAVNHMGIAVFFLTSLGSQMKRYKYLILAWPLAISFAQVYVGVHYPSDVLGGLLIGLFLGGMLSFIYLQLMDKLTLRSVHMLKK